MNIVVVINLMYGYCEKNVQQNNDI